MKYFAYIWSETKGCYSLSSQKSGKVEVSYKEVKQIMQNILNAQRNDWTENFDDALWAYKTKCKTLIGTNPYRMVFGKVCQFLVLFCVLLVNRENEHNW